MKVSTEACILGAWASASSPSRILDIGAGTGLLSLMLAQKYGCEIDAVELEANAAHQSSENFKISPWSERLNLIHTDILSYAKSCKEKYDLIISNPPFFKNSLKSENQAINKAKHDDSLPQDILIGSISKLLSDGGIAYVLYPEREADALKTLAAQYELDSIDALIVRNKKRATIFRKIVALGSVSEIKTHELIIRNNDNQYSGELYDLLQAYYLKL